MTTIIVIAAILGVPLAGIAGFCLGRAAGIRDANDHWRGQVRMVRRAFAEHGVFLGQLDDMANV